MLAAGGFGSCPPDIFRCAPSETTQRADSSGGYGNEETCCSAPSTGARAKDRQSVVDLIGQD